MPKPIFDNPGVTRLMKRYVRSPKDKELRDRIITLTLPLVEASLSKQRMFDKRYREDIRQECILKVIQALPKFNTIRGDAFGFLWATICNMSKTVNEKLHRPSYSLSSDENVQKEAEQNFKNPFQSPENQIILNSVSDELHNVLFNSISSSVPRIRTHRKAARYIRAAVMSGELFLDKPKVIRKLKDIGLDKKNIQLYINRSMIITRERLLIARENATAITHHENVYTNNKYAVAEDL